ncbi:MAG TPA: SRPBCC domain-containing protein [Mycobacteriales bacterium]|nr:SRPBCC domain-containing protein [Mycobacteriales bacterium]
MTVRRFGDSIRIQRDYPYPVSAVWAALTDPEQLAEWLMPNDFRAGVGHRFAFRTRPRPGFDGVVHCEVLTVEAPSLLRYSWRGGPMTEPSIVSWELSATPTGCRVLLRHENLAQNAYSWFVGRTLRLGWADLLRRKLPATVGRRSRAAS